MPSWPAQFLVYHGTGLFLLWRVRRYKYEAMPDKRPLGAGDCAWFLVVALISAAAFQGALWKWLAVGWTALLFFAFWIDALVMNQFSIQVNPHVIKTYLRNIRAMRNESWAAWRGVLFRPDVACYPLLAPLPALFLALGENRQLQWALPCLFLYGWIRPGRFDRIWIPILLSVALLAALEWLLIVPKWAADVCAWSAAIMTLSLPAWRLHARFFHSPSWVQEWMGGRPLRVQPPAHLTEQEQRIIDLPVEPQRTSDYFGRLAGSHVVLVTMESVSASHVACCAGEGARMPVLERMMAEGMSSRRHFCISPNTNNALVALYNGAYFNHFSFPHLAHLQAAGYQSIMVVPQDTRGFNFIGLLNDIGFQHIIDLNQFQEFESAAQVDRRFVCYMVDDGKFYRLALDSLRRLIRKDRKVFLHVMNSQTHPPYLTLADLETHDPAIKYRQAIEESDFNLGELLNELGAWMPPDQTLICYTSDHGQSLGELGYRAHSNSITREQINVPFALSHPRLSRQEIPFSTHFDIFPTLFDLLGIRYSYQTIGRSLFLPDRRLGEVLFSETRHGGTPSCFGYVDLSGKLFVDLTLQRYYRMDWDDHIQSELSGAERDRWQAILLLALRQRGLVGRKSAIEAAEAHRGG